MAVHTFSYDTDELRESARALAHAAAATPEGGQAGSDDGVQVQRQALVGGASFYIVTFVDEARGDTLYAQDEGGLVAAIQRLTLRARVEAWLEEQPV